MTGSERPELAHLVDELRSQRIGRREFMRRAAALGLTAAGLSTLVRLEGAAAQEASPAASGAGTEPGTRSITRAEAVRQIKETYGIVDAPAQGGRVIIPTSADLQTLNGILTSDATSALVADQVFQFLLDGNPDTGQLIPGLADYWELAEDGVTYTFHLRTDKVWHDGTDFSAEDVAFSFESLSNEALASPYTGSFLDAVASWEVVDADTITIVSNGIKADFLNSASFFIIPKHIWEPIPIEQWVNDPGSTGQDPARVVGTGPFTFQSWTQGQEIRLARFDGYTPRPVWLKEMVFRIFTDTEARFNAFLTGDLDTVGLAPEQVETVKQQPDQFTVHTYPYRGFQYYEFNLDPAITTRFQDVRVRQAFMWALDRQSIVDNILLGFGEVANGTQPSISYAYAPEQIRTKYTYDPEKATALLTEAGWTDTNGNGVVDKDGIEMEFEFLYESGSATADSLVAYLQDAWRAVGISIIPKSLEFPALIEATTTNPTFEMALYGFGWDSSFIQDVMFGCDQYQVGFNDMRYCNPELDALADRIKTTLDQEARRELMIEYSNIVNDEQPVGILYFRVENVAQNNRLHNVFPSAWGGTWAGPGIEYFWVDAV
jgi:peptide/nickel transport system substrate-binding protein